MRPTTGLVLLMALLSCRGGETPPPPASTPSAEPAAPASTLRRSAPAPLPSAAARKASPPPTTLVLTPSPSPVAPAAPTAAIPVVDTVRLARLVAEGEDALAHERLAEAVSLFGEALLLDPADPRARVGKARAATTSLGLTRSFVPDLASADGAEGPVKEVEGFDVEDLDVRQAARIPGRAELEGQPRRLKPGDTFVVKVYLRNQSKKKKRVIKINGLDVNKVVNGVRAPLATTILQREVQPKQRVLVATLSGPWEDDVASWTLDVRVSSEVGDLYQNRLFWK